MARAKKVSEAKVGPIQTPPRRVYVKQADVPNASLEEALRLPQAIFDHYAGKPTSPLFVAKALNVDPKGSQLKLLPGAAIAFGLIEGGARAATIAPTELARKIIRPRSENEDVDAKKEAVLRPRVFGDFFRQYDQHPFPRRDLAINVLEEMGVPRGKADGVLDRIEDSAKWVGFIHTIKDKAYVDLSVIPISRAKEVPASIQNEAEENLPNEGGHSDRANEPSDGNAPPTKANERSIHVRGTAMTAAIAVDIRRRRVFITHGKDRALVDPIKKLLEYGELEPVVSVERQSVSKPVPEKVLDDMRSAGAAIIHVDADHSITGADGKEHKFLNSNVLIEIVPRWHSTGVVLFCSSTKA
jgi:hypothetical protein